MQQVAATTIIVNDSGLLTADQIPAFRAFLVAEGFEVRDSGAGQFFHARFPGAQRWLPIERGRAGAPVTPQVLRQYVTSFQTQPPAGATGKARSDRPGELAAARAALSLPVAVPTPAADVAEPAPTPAPLSRYLSDLRDDLALHAPLFQMPDESLRSFAIRRWEYADVMISTRTTKAGD